MRTSVVVVIAACALVACRQEKKGTVIARVGAAELTMEDARAHIDTTQGAIGFRLHEYASSWINAELIYQEAARRGVENTPDFQQELADVKRQLANERYLEDVIYTESGIVSDDIMVEYYRHHRAEFLVRDNMIKLRLMVCSSREQASRFAGKVVQTGNWDEAVRLFRSDSTAPVGATSELPAQYYSQQTLYPPALWKVAAALAMNEVSFPVRAGDKYYVLQPVAAVQQGKPADYELVRDEVRQRVDIERRRMTYENLLGTLRKRYAVELFIGSGTLPDTSQVHE